MLPASIQSSPFRLSISASHRYAPLSVRLVEQALRPGSSWAQIEDALKLLPGPHFEVTQDFEELQPSKPAVGARIASVLSQKAPTIATPRCDQSLHNDTFATSEEHSAFVAFYKVSSCAVTCCTKCYPDGYQNFESSPQKS